MKRLLAFVFVMAALCALGVGAAVNEKTADRVAPCVLEPSVAPTDSMFRVCTFTGNTHGRPAYRWTVMSLGDTARFTFYLDNAVQSFTIPVPPGASISSSQFGNPAVDSVYIDRKSASAFCWFIGFWGL